MTHNIYIYICFYLLKKPRTKMNQECDLEMCLKIGKLHQLAAFQGEDQATFQGIRNAIFIFWGLDLPNKRSDGDFYR